MTIADSGVSRTPRAAVDRDICSPSTPIDTSFAFACAEQRNDGGTDPDETPGRRDSRIIPSMVIPQRDLRNPGQRSMLVEKTALIDRRNGVLSNAR